MSPNVFPSAARVRLRRASRRLASAGWQGASTLSDIALQTMTASIIAGMLLMSAACVMYVVTLALLYADTVQH